MNTNYTTLKAAALKAAAKYTKETPAEEFARTHYRRMVEALEACEEEGISIEQAIEKYSSTRGAQDFVGLLQAALEEVEEVETVEVEVEATEAEVKSEVTTEENNAEITITGNHSGDNSNPAKNIWLQDVRTTRYVPRGNVELRGKKVSVTFNISLDEKYIASFNQRTRKLVENGLFTSSVK